MKLSLATEVAPTLETAITAYTQCELNAVNNDAGVALARVDWCSLDSLTEEGEFHTQP